MPQETGIAENVARLRLDRRMTQATLSDRVGVSRVALGKIERGVVLPPSGDAGRLGARSGRSGRGSGDPGPASPGRPVPRPLHNVRARADPRGSVQVAGCLRLAGGRTQ